MIILITNDDGIYSSGLNILADCMRKDHDVWIAAPDQERSAVSHGITFLDPVRFVRTAPQTYMCSGTPADCILYALHGALPVKPDVVISGINHGVNVGTDIVYSGTVAAARQASFIGVPGIAVSAQTGEGGCAFQAASELIYHELERLTRLWSPQVVININVPTGYDIANGMVLAHPALSTEENFLEVYKRSEDDLFYFLSGWERSHVEQEHPSNDVEVLTSGKASISPVLIRPVVHSESMEHFSRFYAPGQAAGK